MGASKLAQIDSSLIKLGALTRAIGHPTRLKIYQLLKEQKVLRSTDLCNYLLLSKTSIHNHLLKMKDAEVIEFEFLPNCYLLRLNESKMEPLLEFLEKL